jgi:polar amino acid transport system substrate-binding protein
MKTKCLTAAMMFLLFFSPAFCGYGLAEKIVLTSMGDFPPYQYEEKGHATGIDADIVREVCKRLGIELELQIVPWKRGLRMVEEGDYSGLLTALHTEERSKFLYFTKETVHIQKNVIMARKGSGITVKGLEDLKGKTVGVVRAFSYGPEFDNFQGLIKEVCNEQKELIKLLDKERIDVAMAVEQPFLFLSKQLGLAGRFETVHVIIEFPVYTVFSKKLGEKGKALSEQFDTVLKQIKAEGLEQQIIDRYVK